MPDVIDGCDECWLGLACDVHRMLPAIVVNVPGCTCVQRLRGEPDRAEDVCAKCVSYFDLDRWDPEPAGTKPQGGVL